MSKIIVQQAYQEVQTHCVVLAVTLGRSSQIEMTCKTGYCLKMSCKFGKFADSGLFHYVEQVTCHHL